MLSLPARYPLSASTPAPASGHWDDHPIVLMDAADRRRLRAVSAAAGRCGIRAGMTLAEARAICADLEEHPWDEVAIAGAVTEMTAMLLEASPQVTPVPGAPGMWWVGASGFAGWPTPGGTPSSGSEARTGERQLAYALRRIAARWHPRSRVSIADSCVAARAATWAGMSFQQQGDDRSLICVVPHGRDAAYLAPAPLALVPMDDELRASLQALGLRTVGALAALTAEDVERRWGREGLDAWRLARGEDRRRPVLARMPSHPAVETELPMASATMEPVLFLVRAAVEQLTSQLASQGHAVAALAITIALDDARSALPVDALARRHTVTREIRLARPVARAEPLFERCRALLDNWPLTAPASGVTVAVVAVAPLAGEQGDLLAPIWRDPAAVEAALARLRAELGPNVVVKPVALDAHVPERMGRWEEPGIGERGSGAPEPRSIPDLRISASLRLLDAPESVFVVCDDETPRAITWRGRRITIERATGPERLSGDWWDEGYRRDYWRCESAFGEFVLYLDRMDDQWWVQGWYD